MKAWGSDRSRCRLPGAGVVRVVPDPGADRRHVGIDRGGCQVPGRVHQRRQAEDHRGRPGDVVSYRVVNDTTIEFTHDAGTFTWKVKVTQDELVLTRDDNYTSGD